MLSRIAGGISKLPVAELIPAVYTRRPAGTKTRQTSAHEAGSGALGRRVIHQAESLCLPACDLDLGHRDVETLGPGAQQVVVAVVALLGADAGRGTIAARRRVFVREPERVAELVCGGARGRVHDRMRRVVEALVIDRPDRMCMFGQAIGTAGT